MTEKLYYQNGHLARFTARVLSCARDEKGWAVKLDRTAFFPGGGGQEADEGELSGLNLLGLREEGEDVVHLVPEPLESGALVEGKLNWPLRFARMQGHSGEHILSGTVHRLFGCDNVGFHMGEEDITIDFNAELSREDLARAELETNRADYIQAKRDLPQTRQRVNTMWAEGPATKETLADLMEKVDMLARIVHRMYEMDRDMAQIGINAQHHRILSANQTTFDQYPLDKGDGPRSDGKPPEGYQ